MLLCHLLIIGIEFFFILVARSKSILIMKIVFVVLVTWTKLHCSYSISGLILRRDLFIKILIINCILCFINLIFRIHSRLDSLATLRRLIYWCLPVFHRCHIYISFIALVTLVPKSSKAVGISIISSCSLNSLRLGL